MQNQTVFTLPLQVNNGSMGSSGSGRRLYETGKLSPLYRGYGTHYAFIWVGSPPQRVSVIVDTGSHHTAFPCSGCNCGKHMNELFDPRKSETSQVVACISRGGKCTFQQSYSEGSSWKAHKVIDEVWVGGSTLTMVPGGAKLSTKFTFGCMQSETGLFRNQIVDGIMGMSAAADTLIYKLFDNKVLDSRAFSMCFKVDGGVLALGGLDERLNHSPMQYIRLLKPKGWFTVRLLEVAMIKQGGNNDSSNHSSSTGAGVIKKVIDAPVSIYNTGKGTIVDSGTTDSYLPTSISKKFTPIFKELSGGLNYHNKVQTITPQQFKKLPIIVFTLEGSDGGKIMVKMPPESYAEEVGTDKYGFRVYVNEPSGTVLGANFMNNHNVHFDIDKKRIGFSESVCTYEDIVKIDRKGQRADEEAELLFDKTGTRKKQIEKKKERQKQIQKQKQKQKQKAMKRKPAPNSGKQNVSTDCVNDGKSSPMDICDAKCSKIVVTRYEATGQQKWTDNCSPAGFVIEECKIFCEPTESLASVSLSQSVEISQPKKDIRPSAPQIDEVPSNLGAVSSYETIIIYATIATIVVLISLLYRYSGKKAYSGTTQRRSSNSSGQGGRYRRMNPK